MNNVVRSLPHSFGDCSDDSANPPQPCRGSAPLYESGSEESGKFTKAVWFGGLSTMHFDACSLTRKSMSASAWGSSQFRLSVSGQFDQIKLYIRAHNGPIVMDSADHCCGKNISFNLGFVVDCIP